MHRNYDVEGHGCQEKMGTRLTRVKRGGSINLNSDLRGV
jgi:hypothetical protein